KWLDGLQGIEAALPPEQSVLVLADREADVFDYLAAERRPSTHLLVRAQSPRRVRFSPSEGARAPAEPHLFAALGAAPVVGELRVLVPRTREHREREARLELRCLHLWVLPPANRQGKDGLRPVEVWVIQARELAPPAGEAGIEWVLLSTLPVLDGGTAGCLVQYYSRRWGIERPHFTLKSGLRVEGLLFDDATSLQHALALCYVVAWRLLWLTYLARLEPEAPAESLLDPNPFFWTRTEVANGRLLKRQAVTSKDLIVPKKTFTEEQIMTILRAIEAGASAVETCRTFGITETTSYRWKRKYEGLDLAELRRLKQLEEENKKLKQLVADLSLDKSMLQEVLRKKF
ncbi:MAG TPA: IS4 family transposase, partial [Armatimonadota bacterium]|nr:IS4 family transposase [Armatimonadota bacterium]